MKFRRSVTRFIVYTLAIGFILYSGIIITIVKSNLSGGLTKYFNEEVIDQSQVLKDEMQAALDNALSTAKFIQKSYEDIFPDYGFDRTIMNSFAEGAQQYQGAKNIVFFNSFGMQVSSPIFGSIPKNDDVKAALAGSETVKFEKGEGDESNDIFVTVILPLKSEDRTFGVVEIRTPITTEALINSVKDYSNCDISIFSDNVRILTTIKNMQGTTLDDATILEDSKNGKATLTTNLINNQKYISYYFPFTDSNGKYLTTLYIGKSMEIASNLTSKIFKPLIVAIVIFTAIFLFYFLFIIHYKVTAPLRKVRKAVSNLSSGDANLTQRLDTSRGDEFADLSGEVNKFIEMLQKIIKELNDSQSSLNEVSLSLGDNAQDSASATAQILANIESVRKQSQNQSEAVQNTSTVLEMSSTSVDVLSDLIEHQTASVTQSSAAIEEMLGNISAVTNSVKKMSTSFGELGNTVDDGKSKLSSVDQKVKQIAEQSKMLIEANKVIAQIASETNLLAMNAAIEAAHAGDSGKGFSVVAEEIRKLAENSGVQAKNISSELKGISDSIQDVVSLSRTSETAFDAIVEQLDSTDMIIQEITNAMEEQQTASKQIFESLSDMKNQSTEVASKAHDMSQGIEKVAKDMNTVSQISSTILGSMDEMTTGMQQIGDATQNVSNLAGQTKDNIEIMSNKLNLFKV